MLLLMPVLLGHVYWLRKEAFLLEEDRYQQHVMFAVCEGEFEYEIDGQKGKAAFGDLICCPAGTLFRRTVHEPLTFHFFTIEWLAVQDRMISKDRFPSGKLTLHDHDRLASTYRYMAETGVRGSASPELYRSGLDHYLKDLWQQYVLEQQWSREMEGNAAVDGMMLEAAEYLRDHALGRLSIKSLAAQLGMTAVQLTRKFKAAYGETPMDYVIGLRMEKAAALLLGTTLPLVEIAEACGYESGFYFSRLFHSRKGMPPSVYRKMHQL
ncbi:AraC family transcriptional regulator [Paenibacillaceae bacterium]|nr:AraC family transcriptional regulator [Paenibacillaceae bacterium]